MSTTYYYNVTPARSLCFYKKNFTGTRDVGGLSNLIQIELVPSQLTKVILSILLCFLSTLSSF